jgi:hypothetical protein
MALGLACTGTLACSNDYALGDLPEQQQAVSSTPPGAPLAPAPDGQPAALAEQPPAPRPDLALGPSLPLPDVTMRSETDKPRSDASRLITGVGDLDGDGFQDFATQCFDLATETEYVHVRYGGPRPRSGEEALILQESGARLLISAQEVAQMVETIVPAGDVDGDGYADMLVGTSRCSPAVEGEGAYLLYGGPERLSGVHRFDQVGVYLSTPHDRLTPEQATSPSSCFRDVDDLAALGDFDGDGLDDFVIGDAPQLQYSFDLNTGESTITGDPNGSLYVFYGSHQRLVAGSSWATAASARVVGPGELLPRATGDLDADGHADLIVNPVDATAPSTPTTPVYWIPGRSERLSGDLELATNLKLEGLSLYSNPGIATLTPNDVDGDGVADLLAVVGDDELLIFGRPGLFANGVDPSQGTAVLSDDLSGSPFIESAGDRDGDGDTDLYSYVTYSWADDNQPLFVNNFAFVGGSRQRFGGRISFPAQAVLQSNPTGSLLDSGRFITRIAQAGDLDGDGASDLITTSLSFDPLSDDNAYVEREPRLHIHYGVPGGIMPDLH